MSWQTEKEALGRQITRKCHKAGLIKTWYRDKREGWELVSRFWSPYYISLKYLPSFPELYRTVAVSVGRMLEEEAGYKPDGHRIVGIANTGIAIANGITLVKGIPSCWTRKIEGVRSLEEMERWLEMYGHHSMIEGEIADNDVLGLCDDVAAFFDSKLIADRQVEHEVKRRKLHGIKCVDVAVVFDREHGAKEKAVESGKNLFALIPFATQGLEWLKDNLTGVECEVLADYSRRPERYQSKEVQKELFEMSVAPLS